jgi:CubicO group peptidase (beta-lactamase class C family)
VGEAEVRRKVEEDRRRLVEAGFAGEVYLCCRGQEIAFEGSGVVGQNEIVTQHLIASLSKAFTGFAIHELARRGQLAREDQLARFFSVPCAFEGVTVQDLLNHTSGVTDGLERGELEDLDLEHSAHAVLERYLELHPQPEPRRFSYANMNYSFLGAIVEQVTEQSHEAAMRELIFAPLELSQTRFVSESSALTPGCKLAEPTRGATYKAPFDWLGYKGSDGILSTTRDLARFLNRLVRPTFVRDFDEQGSSFCASSDITNHMYGYGWYFELGSDGLTKVLRSIWHGGASWPEAYLAYAKYDVERDVELILLSHSPEAQEAIGAFIEACSSL